MNHTDLYQFWKEEESIAHIHGWDFSHIDGRCIEETNFPWDYREAILAHLHPDMRLLDIDTGGGEFLLSLNHPHANTAATEAWQPNIELCRETLLPLGVDFRPGDGKGPLPFPDGCFDMVINRHGDYCAAEISRVLKQGGLFITQQVGAENDRELVELLLPGATELPFPDQYLSVTQSAFQRAGFHILDAKECFRSIRFTDVGALVWFARVLPWEFPDFSVDACMPRLELAHHLVETNGFIEGRVHRYFLIAQKD